MKFLLKNQGVKVKTNFYVFLIKKCFSICQATYQKELYLLFDKSGIFLQSEHRDRGLSPLPLSPAPP